jgi:hypothetical protein
MTSPNRMSLLRARPNARVRAAAMRECGVCGSSALRWTKVAVAVPFMRRGRVPSVAQAKVPHGECLSCGLQFRTWEAACRLCSPWRPVPGADRGCASEALDDAGAACRRLRVRHRIDPPLGDRGHRAEWVERPIASIGAGFAGIACHATPRPGEGAGTTASRVEGGGRGWGRAARLR